MANVYIEKIKKDYEKCYTIEMDDKRNREFLIINDDGYNKI